MEVKTRSGTGYGLPSEAVDAKKQLHLLRAARSYLEQEWEELKDWQPACYRFDVVEILLKDGKASQYRILRDAFQKDASQKGAFQKKTAFAPGSHGFRLT